MQKTHWKNLDQGIPTFSDVPIFDGDFSGKATAKATKKTYPRPGAAWYVAWSSSKEFTCDR